jgi:hypothetical protein
LPQSAFMQIRMQPFQWKRIRIQVEHLNNFFQIQLPLTFNKIKVIFIPMHCFGYFFMHNNYILPAAFFYFILVLSTTHLVWIQATIKCEPNADPDSEHWTQYN